MSVRPAPKTSGDGRSSEKVVSQLKKISVVIGLTIGLTAAGCAGSSRPASGALPLIGRWRQTTLGSGSESKPCPAQIAVLEGGVVSCGQHATVELQPDGTYRRLAPEGTEPRRQAQWQFREVSRERTKKLGGSTKKARADRLVPIAVVKESGAPAAPKSDAK